MIFELMVCLMQIVQLSYNDTNIVTLSKKNKNEIPHGPVQNDLLAYGTFGTNRVPILLRN